MDANMSLSDDELLVPTEAAGICAIFKLCQKGENIFSFRLRACSLYLKMTRFSKKYSNV